MIDLMRGNLLDADADALVNTVNCVGVMGKGIALQFKQAFPGNYKVYERACRAGEVEVGRMLVVPMLGEHPRFIINFPTKRHWRGKSRLEDIEAGLQALVGDVRRLGLKSVAVPPLGCGNGGLDWSEVRPRIERAFEALPGVEVLLFEPDGAPVADEMRVRTKRPDMTPGRAILIAVMERYQGIGYRLTLLEIQKLAYLLQRAGEQLKLNYVKDKYGPYAENLNFVLQATEGHFTRGYGDRSRGAEIAVLPDGIQEASNFLQGHEESLHRLERVSRLIEGFETPHGMELIATVDWAVHELGNTGRDLGQVVAAVHSWNERKRRIFGERAIGIAWERLSREGWVTSSAP